MHCGFCLPTCPTYVLWGQEMDSPRGRIYLMQMASDGVLSMTPQWVQHFDTCLGCMACMPACPSGVDYGKLIEATRAQIERRYTRSRAERWYRSMALCDVAAAGAPAMAAVAAGVLSAHAARRRSSAGVGLLKWLPTSMRTMEALMPPLGAARADRAA